MVIRPLFFGFLMGKTPQSLASKQVPDEHYDRLETLLKNLPGMAYRCLNLKHWPMDFVSEGCFELCGYHKHEIESQSVLWGDFTHPEMIDEVDRTVREAADLGEPFEVEYRIITREGIEKWVWERGRVIDHRNDGVAILEGFITDITDRKLAEAALIEAEAYAQAIVDSALDAVITVDQDGSIESFNQVARDMFGFRLGEVKGKHCRSLIAASYYREFDQFLQRREGQAHRASRSVELNARHKQEQEFPVVMSMREMRDAEERKSAVRRLTKTL